MEARARARLNIRALSLARLSRPSDAVHRDHAHMIEVVLNDRLGKKIRVKCKCVGDPRVVAPPRAIARARAAARRSTNHSFPRLIRSSLLPPTRSEDDTIGDLKKLVAAQTGTRPEKLRIQKWYNIYKDHITLEDYEIHDGMGLELYYN